jgi:hypothetical protein
MARKCAPGPLTRSGALQMSARLVPVEFRADKTKTGAVPGARSPVLETAVLIDEVVEFGGVFAGDLVHDFG